MAENRVLMAEARKSLKGKWGTAIIAYLVMWAISMLAGYHKLGWIVSILITGPLTFGVAMFSLGIARDTFVEIKTVFAGFSHFFLALRTHLLRFLFIFLWALLLIIPGIIAAISYSMTFFILADEPNLSALDALKKSKRMMQGFKWKLVTLHLRFIGWAILSVFSFGIGFIWLTPYIKVTEAKFYDDLKKGSEVAPAVM